jgi:prophage regulatory protein
MSTEVQDVRLVRLPEVQRLTGLRRSQLYALAALDRFPRPVKLSERCSAWPESEVRSWIASRISDSRAGMQVAA